MLTTISDTTQLETGIGEKIAILLYLKSNRETGRFDTCWGNKTAQGLGASVLRLVMEETELVNARRERMSPPVSEWMSGTALSNFMERSAAIMVDGVVYQTPPVKERDMDIGIFHDFAITDGIDEFPLFTLRLCTTDGSMFESKDNTIVWYSTDGVSHKVTMLTPMIIQ